jgi:hypothetical protein
LVSKLLETCFHDFMLLLFNGFPTGPERDEILISIHSVLQKPSTHPPTPTSTHTNVICKPSYIHRHIDTRIHTNPHTQTDRVVGARSCLTTPTHTHPNTHTYTQLYVHAEKWNLPVWVSMSRTLLPDVDPSAS